MVSVTVEQHWHAETVRTQYNLIKTWMLGSFFKKQTESAADAVTTAVITAAA
jgi:hypothetical protein